MDNWEMIAALSGLAAVIAAYLPFLIGANRHAREIAMWRQSVEDRLSHLDQDTDSCEAARDLRLTEIEASIARLNERLDDMGKTLASLAELAGRALGRTEGKS